MLFPCFSTSSYFFSMFFHYFSKFSYFSNMLFPCFSTCSYFFPMFFPMFFLVFLFCPMFFSMCFPICPIFFRCFPCFSIPCVVSGFPLLSASFCRSWWNLTGLLVLLGRGSALLSFAYATALWNQVDPENLWKSMVFSV